MKLYMQMYSKREPFQAASTIHFDQRRSRHSESWQMKKKENFHSNTWILRMQLVLEGFRARLDDIQVQYEQVKDDIWYYQLDTMKTLLKIRTKRQGKQNG